MNNGWLPPPRPIYVAPSYDPSDTDEITRWKILLDWPHDDDMKNFVTSQKMMLWEFGGAPAIAGHFNSFPTDKLIAFYFLGSNPSAEQIADFAIKYDAFIDEPPDPGDPGQQVSIPSDAPGTTRTVATRLPAAWVTIWNGLDDTITNKVIPKRAALGPLPANTYLDESGNLADPVIINYYDDQWIKRIKYPSGTIQAASTQDQWWNVGAGSMVPTIEQWASNGTDIVGNRSPRASYATDADWYPDGWDFAKGSGAFFDIMHAIVSVLILVLSATGIGTVAAAFIGAILNIALDFIQAAETALMGGNPAVALLNVGSAILSVGSAEIGQLASASPSLAKLGKLGITELGSILKQVGTDLSPPHQTLSVGDQLDLLRANASKYGVMTLDNFNAVLSIVSGNGSVSVPLAQGGWDTSQYASRDDLTGVGLVYQVAFPGPAAALWAMGAQLGTLSKTQADMGIQAPVSPWARLPNLKVTVVPMLVTPQMDLMNYVRYTLAPRYNIPT
jgi:hypothetical protein